VAQTFVEVLLGCDKKVKSTGETSNKRPRRLL